MTNEYDIFTDIQFNFSPEEITRALKSLSRLELEELKEERQALIGKQTGILMRVEQRLNFLTSKGC